MMPSEHTSLLHEEHAGSDKHYDDVYDRFTRAQKGTIVALISMAGIAPCAFHSSLVWQTRRSGVWLTNFGWQF